ncbi:hypothetical protein SACE_2302 [Saccharopolyspora erythraea NRRL 2338]|uniref:Uncharacterized protein n=1 Tax=Saccharopolyspora erythraea (strain ATCC 11635 / DSM 40517 / JCM 4748 / NBRC 13426 / NCIMB 8594 / NRRL 2338) TaxID=405948 RepID=A4FC29_SACEN|nr:hypothetical protein SACE_2302 [Saccharopolyspora erythraea NRRL 2338]
MSPNAFSMAWLNRTRANPQSSNLGTRPVTE